MLFYLGQYYHVRPNTRKAAQSGVKQSWKNWANDSTEHLCGMRHMILMAQMYGDEIEPTGPLFRQVDAQGRILETGVVSAVFVDIALFLTNHRRHPKSATHCRKIFKHSVILNGPYTALTRFAEVDANIALRKSAGLLPCVQHGVVGHLTKLPVCFVTSTLRQITLVCSMSMIVICQSVAVLYIVYLFSSILYKVDMP